MPAVLKVRFGFCEPILEYDKTGVARGSISRTLPRCISKNSAVRRAALRKRHAGAYPIYELAHIDEALAIQCLTSVSRLLFKSKGHWS